MGSLADAYVRRWNDPGIHLAGVCASENIPSENPFITKENERLFPDREHLEQLKRGEQRKWADVSNSEAEQADGYEWKNLVALAGAMEERTPTIVAYIESWMFNSNKCFCSFEV